MSFSIIIRLLICMSVLLLSCRGFKDPRKSQNRHIRDLYNKDLEINSTNWYLNLKIPELNEEIQNILVRIENRYRSEDILSDISRLRIGSQFHGQLIDSQPTNEGNSGSQNAQIIFEVTRSLMHTYCLKHGLGAIQCAKDLTKVKITRTTLREMCLAEYYNETSCIGKNLNYRSPDGSCNNLKSSSLGKATLPYKRLLFPVYIDGIYDMPDNYDYKKLPNPRSLSSDLVKDENLIDRAKTMMMAYWTIFIGHDISHTAVSSIGKNNRFVKCCDDDRSIQYTLNKYIRSCKPIFIPNDDRFFKPGTCMNYVRSMPAMRSDCTFGPMEQMNQATHYLDASMIYGSSEQQTLSLRKMTGGELLTIVTETNHEYMPLENIESNACQQGNAMCFKAGDIRANALPQLSVMHTLWMREHNRVARGLAYFNQLWTDDRIFLEAKKIVTAYIQHITYNEWLPALLGVNYTKEEGLGLLEDGYSKTYDDTADPTVSNSFATAILPFANSMLSDTISLYSQDRVISGSLSLKEYYNQPVDVVVNYMDQLVRGLTTQNTQKVDMLFTQTITNYLYSIDPNDSFGMDTVSLNIQRSRDHGIPSYTQFRKYCGLRDIENVQDLSKIMVEGSADRLLKLYTTWDDIDLLVGALLEKHVDDAMVGPTMRCIIREQFVRTRIADRYFYDLPEVFTKDQLTEIRKMTLARIICNNANNVTMIQKQVFLKPALTDELQLCNTELNPTIFINNHFDQICL